ncbi:MAG: GyrI-like domain-containing protein [Cyclobacteriaceae bacterium]
MQEPKIVEVDDRTLIAARMPMSLLENRTRELWQGFRSRVTEIENRVGSDFFSIQHYPDNFNMANFRPDTVFEKLAGIEVEKRILIPNGMESYTLVGGKYAVFTHHGPAAEAAKTFQHIYGVWMPKSSYEPDSRDQFEILGPDYRPDDPKAKEQVWIPIKSYL